MALILSAHPNIETSTSNKTILQQLEQSGLEIEVRDLSRLYPHFEIDVEAEQAALQRHSTIVFQYPFYWYNMPAILKHWFDKVFTYQFAYGSKGDQLKGRNFLASFTVGAPETGYKTLADHHFRVLEFCKNIEQTAYYAQMNYIDPIVTYGHSVNAGIAATEITAKAEQHAQKLIAQLELLG